MPLFSFGFEVYILKTENIQFKTCFVIFLFTGRNASFSWGEKEIRSRRIIYSEKFYFLVNSFRFTQSQEKARWLKQPKGFPCVKKIRRRSTLPYSCPHSTIDAERLNCRVRKGNGWDPLAIATGNRYSSRTRVWPRKENRALGSSGKNLLNE